MRETCTSGSSRGEWIARHLLRARLLSYSTGFSWCPGNKPRSYKTTPRYMLSPPASSSIFGSQCHSEPSEESRSGFYPEPCACNASEPPYQASLRSFQSRFADSIKANFFIRLQRRRPGLVRRCIARDSSLRSE